MSVRTPTHAEPQERQHQTDACAYCEVQFPISRAAEGSYCSLACADSHKREKAARNVIRTLEKDHRYCATCFRPIKEVEKPPQRWGMSDAVVGFQYGTQHADVVWKETHGRKRTGLGCECGNCEHYHDEETLQSHSLMTAVYFLTEALEELRTEDKLDVTVDHNHLFQAAIDVGKIRPALEVAIQR